MCKVSHSFYWGVKFTSRKSLSAIVGLKVSNLLVLTHVKPQQPEVVNLAFLSSHRVTQLPLSQFYTGLNRSQYIHTSCSFVSRGHTIRLGRALANANVFERRACLFLAEFLAGTINLRTWKTTENKYVSGYEPILRLLYIVRQAFFR